MHVRCSFQNILLADEGLSPVPKSVSWNDSGSYLPHVLARVLCLTLPRFLHLHTRSPTVSFLCRTLLRSNWTHEGLGADPARSAHSLVICRCRQTGRDGCDECTLLLVRPTGGLGLTWLSRLLCPDTHVPDPSPPCTSPGFAYLSYFFWA